MGELDEINQKLDRVINLILSANPDIQKDLDIQNIAQSQQIIMKRLEELEDRLDEKDKEEDEDEF